MNTCQLLNREKMVPTIRKVVWESPETEYKVIQIQSSWYATAKDLGIAGWLVSNTFPDLEFAIKEAKSK